MCITIDWEVNLAVQNDSVIDLNIYGVLICSCNLSDINVR